MANHFLSKRNGWPYFFLQLATRSGSFSYAKNITTEEQKPPKKRAYYSP
jgi:hypothetical protein